VNSEIFRAVSSRDGEVLARMAGDGREQAKVISSDAERLVDALFRQLKQVFPASTQTNLRSEAEEAVAKQQWIATFAENGIRSREQLSAGMQKARASVSPFWPSPGQFVAWCREGKGALGVSPADVMTEFWKWRKLVFRYPTSEQYPWPQPVLYHICLELRRRGVDRQMNEKELLSEAGNLLAHWEKRVAEGKPVPPVRRALAAPKAEQGPTPAQILMAEFKRRQEQGRS